MRRIGKRMVPELRFPGFTDDWEQRKVKDVAPLQRGFDLPTNKMELGNYPVVMSNGIGGYHSKFKVKGPGVVTGRSGTIGNLHYIECDYWPHNTALWVTDFKKNYPKFIYYLYQRLDLSRFGSGSGVPTLNRNDVHDAVISVPHLSEQQRIAEFMTSLDNLITLHQRECELLEQLKKGAMQKIFSQEVRFRRDDGTEYPEWEKNPLGNIATYLKGAPLSKSDICENGTPFILYGELYTTYGEVVTDIARRTKKTVSDEYISRVGDVLIPTSGESPEEISTATCVMAPGVILAGDLYIVRNSVLNGCVLSYILNHQVNGDIAKIAQGKSIVHLRWDDLKKIIITYPPDTKEQQKIADFLSSFDEAIALARQELEKYKLLKKGLMQQMFV